MPADADALELTPDPEGMRQAIEYIHVQNGGPWYIQRAGFFTFTSAPSNLGALLPQDAALDPSRWNLTPLTPLERDYQVNFTQGDWTIDIPRPTYAIWFGDNWRVNDQLTVNYGIRYDLDQGATDPPDTKNDTPFAPLNGPLFKDNIRDNNNISPRLGFAWNVGRGTYRSERYRHRHRT